MPTFAQYLTDDLDGVGPMGPTGINTDELEIYTTANCQEQPVCRSAPPRAADGPRSHSSRTSR
jgi:hypothetical protein